MKISNLLNLVLVLVVSYFTYFDQYTTPQALFWDESYHVASAQKYLHGVYFMEPHPPLGKLLIALGEYVWKTSAATNQFLDTMHARAEDAPNSFKLDGYRFFPVLLAWLSAGILYILLLNITKQPLISLVVSFFYVFDNALIVHSRGAMLEGPQLFFIITYLAVFSFLLNLREPKIRTFLIATLGVLFGLVMTTKVNGIFLVLPFAYLCAKEYPRKIMMLKSSLIFFSSFVVTYLIVWSIHFSLARNVNPRLDNQGYFLASESYRAILDKKQGFELFHLPELLWDSFRFFSHYTRGVPRLNMCKQGEGGSPSFLWPIGARAINYRWENHDELRTKYLYLQVNPFVWWFSFSSVLMYGAFLVAKIFFSASITLQHGKLAAFYILMYLCYMTAMLQLDRAMYLYHYFIPLIFSFVISGMLLTEIKTIFRFRVNRVIVSSFILVATGVSFYWYHPLTYYKPLTKSEVESRALASIWDLTCYNCSGTNRIFVPGTSLPNSERYGHLHITGVIPEFVSIAWGQAKANKTVTDKPLVVRQQEFISGLGVHARSRLEYPLHGNYQSFESFVAIPDYAAEAGGSVIFEIHLDDVQVWKSGVVNKDRPIEKVVIDTGKANYLSLIVTDAGDGNHSDHACWIEPKLGGVVTK